MGEASDDGEAMPPATEGDHGTSGRARDSKERDGGTSGRARDSADVKVVDLDGREVLLVGTAHVSRESADLAEQLIAEERPDRVCVELDERRYEALRQEENFESLDLREVLRRKQLAALMFNLILASYQKQLGGRLGVQPGAELLAAARAAEAIGIPVSLSDRDVRITLRRAWGALSLWHKAQLFGAMIASLFESPDLSEEDLRELRQSDVVTHLLDELGQAFPDLKTALIDERDLYLAEKIRAAPGRRVVAVLGAGHLQGVQRVLRENESGDLEPLEEVPPVSPLVKAVGWSIPAVIVGAIVTIGLRQGAVAAGENIAVWFLVNGVLAMAGAVIALAHPATIATAFLSAPITSLTPVIGVGYVAAFAQTYVRPPLVRELRSVMTDMRQVGKWWSNRLLRIFLVFLLTTWGSIAGTFIGGTEILSNLGG